MDHSLSRVDELQRQGKLQDAVNLLREIVHREPDNTEALAKFALFAFQSGHPDKCVSILEKALEAAPDDPKIHYRLGLTHLSIGNHDESIRALERTTQLSRHDASAHLKLGTAYLAANQDDKASKAFQYAILLQPALRHGHDDNSLPETTRHEIRVANDTLQFTYKSMVNETLEQLEREFPRDDLSRIRSSFRFMQGEEEKRYCHPMQKPEFLLFPDMDARPWFEREEFDWVKDVEAATGDIKAELNVLLEDEAEFLPYIGGVSDQASATSYSGTDFSSLANNHAWDSFHFWKAGVIEENCARCPATVAAMNAVPQAQARDYMPEIFFSVLRPNAHIIPHYGQMNIRLTVHLGLIVPDGCGIRVGDETRQWEEGKTLAFDDSFEHEAYNRGKSDRIVLIFETWHPDLRPAEIAGLQSFFEKRGAWMANFDIKPDLPH